MSGKSIVALYIDQTGGAVVATKHLISSKVFNEKLIIHEIKNYLFFESCNTRFAFLKITLKNALLLYKKINEYNHSISFYTIDYEIAAYSLLASFFKRKVYFHFHGEPLGDVCSFRNRMHFLKFYIYFYPLYNFHAFLLRIALQHSRKIFVPSEATRSLLNGKYSVKNEIILIPNAVDHKIFKPPLDNKKRKYILYVGKISREKGIYTLIKCAVKDYPSYKYCFVFNESTNNKKVVKIKKIFEKYKNILICSGLSHKKLASLYQQSIIAVLPSKDEQLPLVYLEAMACGTPMITASVGGLSYFQKQIDVKLLMNKVTEKDLSRRIKYFYFLKNSQMSKIQQKLLDFSQQFSWEESSKLLLNGFNEK